MILDILTEPNPFLFRKAAAVSAADLKKPETRKFLDDLAETMVAKDGVGLSATQTGVDARIIAIRATYNPFDPKKELVIANPVWEKVSGEKVYGEEGCLSVPGIYGQVKRYKKIKVSGLAPDGKKIGFTAEDFLARIIQHEVDHLDGILFISKAKDLYRPEENKS